MTKIIISAFIILVISISANAYDKTKAHSFENFYSKFTQKACADSKLFITGEDTMKMFKEGKNFTLLDVRTLGEHSIISINATNSIYIPLKDLLKENLDKLPTEGTIIVVCHSGTRATLAAIGLKQVGIKNTRVLKGGLVALAEANNPKNAPMK